MSFEKRLLDLRITLPEPVRPLASYVPVVITGNLAFVSGQLPLQAGQPTVTGPVTVKTSIEDAAAAARLCGLHILSQLRAACGSLDRVKQCVRLGGFVQCPDGFSNPSAVVNGASELMLEVFGEQGRHARTSLGLNALPLDASVEIEAVFLLN